MSELYRIRPLAILAPLGLTIAGTILPWAEDGWGRDLGAQTGAGLVVLSYAIVALWAHATALAGGLSARVAGVLGAVLSILGLLAMGWFYANHIGSCDNSLADGCRRVQLRAGLPLSALTVLLYQAMAALGYVRNRTTHRRVTRATQGS